MSDTYLRELYEDSATPLSSALRRAERQAAMLARLPAAAGHQMTTVTIGCDDSMCTEVALNVCEATANASVGFVEFDWSNSSLESCTCRGVPVARASADDGGSPLALSRMDVVIMNELIEHRVNPDNTLEEPWRVLIPGGTLLNLYGIHGRRSTAVVGHLRQFTRRALARLLKAMGFVDIRIKRAPHHDVPRPLKPLDRLFCHVPSLASKLLAAARKPG